LRRRNVGKYLIQTMEIGQWTGIALKATGSRSRAR
jgi:hypothetical protein